MHSPFLIVVIAVALGVVLDAVIKHATVESALLTLVAWRFLFGALIAVPVYLLAGHRMPKAEAARFHLVRAFFQIIAVLTFFWALGQLALAEATVLGFTAALMMPPVARVVLGEKITPVAALAGLLGFAGAALSVSAVPTGAPDDGDRLLGALAALTAAFAYAVSVVLMRLRTRSEDAATLALFNNSYPAVFFFGLLLAAEIAGRPFAPLLADTSELPVFAFLGLLGFSIWWLMSEAYRHAQTQVLAPFEYLALPLSALFGLFFFGEVPGWRLYVGALIIVAACLVVLFEGRLRLRRPVNNPLA